MNTTFISERYLDMLKGYISKDISFSVNRDKVSCEDSFLLPSLQEIVWEQYSPSVDDMTNENAIGKAIIELYEGKIIHYSDLPEDDPSMQFVIREDELDTFF